MFQIKNHQKSVKNAKIGDFWGKKSKSGDALKSGNFGILVNSKFAKNHQKLRGNANIC